MARKQQARGNAALERPEAGVEMRLRLPKSLHTALVVRARRNNRILIGEVRQILQDAIEAHAAADRVRAALPVAVLP